MFYSYNVWCGHSAPKCGTLWALVRPDLVQGFATTRLLLICKKDTCRKAVAAWAIRVSTVEWEKLLVNLSTNDRWDMMRLSIILYNQLKLSTIITLRTDICDICDDRTATPQDALQALLCFRYLSEHGQLCTELRPLGHIPNYTNTNIIPSNT